MRYFFIVLTAWFCIASCNLQPKKEKPKVKFNVRSIQLASDTTIKSIAFAGSSIVCLQNNGKFILLDSNYHRQISMENKLNRFSIEFMFGINDSTIVASRSGIYYLNNDLELKKLGIKYLLYGTSLYNDSLYHVYGCCMGEFGGSVFFVDKKTKKTYSYFATCPSQVLKFENDYVVCNNLAHLSLTTRFSFIREPKNLYELTNEKQKYSCNWYVTVDSLKDDKKHKAIEGVSSYDGDKNTMSLISFPFRDSLYSVVGNDKSVMIYVHRPGGVAIIDTLMRKPILFHEVQVASARDKMACLYKLTGGSPFAAYSTRGNATGIIIVERGKNDILLLRNNNLNK